MAQQAGFSFAEALHKMEYELTVTDLAWAEQNRRNPAKIVEELLKASHDPAVVLGACVTQNMCYYEHI